MFSWLKQVFGRKVQSGPTPEEEAAARAFDEEKQRSLDAALGPMEDTVIHAIIPYFIGGSLDLYPYRRHIPGTVYVTQELLTLDVRSRPKKSRDGWFELAVAFRDSEQEALKSATSASDGEMPASVGLASGLLNPIARYSEMAALGPGETAELPGDDGEPNTCIVLDRLACGALSAGGTPFFLLLVIQVHPAELAMARSKGSAALIALLKRRGYYPYSNLDRPSVA
jgi:hypothetical protein